MPTKAEPKKTKAKDCRNKRSEDKVKKILELIEAGVSKEASCKAVGITARTFRNWCAEDDSLAEKVNTAIDSSEARLLLCISKAAGKDWRAAREMLSIRFPAKYGRHRVEVSGPNGQPIKTVTETPLFDLSGLSDKELNDIIAKRTSGKGRAAAPDDAGRSAPVRKGRTRADVD